MMGLIKKGVVRSVWVWLIAGVLLVVPAAASAACPNEALRTGASAQLPDCRAYELVSPPNTGGRFLEGYGSLHYNDFFPIEAVNASGGSVVFSTIESPLPGGPAGNGSVDGYAATRTAAGWSTTDRLTVPGSLGVLPDAGGVTDSHDYAFVHVSPTSGSGFTPYEAEGGSDLLRKPDGTFEMTGLGSLGEERLAQGRYISPDGSHVIFVTGKQIGGSGWCAGKCKVKKLENEAPETGTGAVYDRVPGGPTRVISLLPSGLPPAPGEDATYQGASRNGEAVAFKVAGSLYVRVENRETKKATDEAFTYGGFSAGGQYLFYVGAGAVHRFNTQTGSDQEIVDAGAEAKIVTISADGSHVYFISDKVLGGSAAAGEPNLYVWDGTAINFIATVAKSDLPTPIFKVSLGNWTSEVVDPEVNSDNDRGKGPGASGARTTPDGQILAFESRARLTSYDNDGHTEIYRFDDRDQSLLCVSCNPAGTAPLVDARFENGLVLNPALIVNNLSEDGNHVFFETSEALLAADVDGVNDIYEWRLEGDGSGEPPLSLISSGKSVEFSPLQENNFLPKPNLILGINPSGSDVVFTASEALVEGAGEGGTQAIYDARVGGGFPAPASVPGCTEEGCRSGSPAAPSLGFPASEADRPNGNVKPHRPRCARRKSKGSPHRCNRKHRDCKKQERRRCARHRSGSARASALAGQPEAVSPSAGSPASQSAGPTTASATSEDGGTSSAPRASVISPAEEFGIKSVSAALSSPQAGAHADFVSSFVLNSHLEGGEANASGRTEGVSLELPPGLTGIPAGIPKCQTGEFVAFGNCPVESQVGVAKILLSGHPPSDFATEPLFNLAPPHPHDEVARLGFVAAAYPVFIDVKVRTSGDYGITVVTHGNPAQASLLAVTTTIWGNPGSTAHDEQRLSTLEAIECPDGTACKAPGGKRSVPPTPGFMTNPSACQSGEVGFSVTSYQLPGQVFSKSAPLPPITDCQGLPFAPSLEARPTTDVAGAPTGLKTSLVIPQTSDPSARATSTMREARVTLPEGMTINPSAANGLAACSDDQVHYHEEADARCPDASKLGTARITSPALSVPIEGAVYQRTPGGKGAQFGLWLVSDDLGLHIKIPGEIKPNPDTGQLTAVFADLPQVPVGQIDLDIWGGARAPLKNPDTCGTYETTSVLTPWSSDPVATPGDRYQITRGPGGGACPTSATAQPNSPAFEAGTASPISATYSPFVMRLRREDGTQPFGALDLTLPPGLIGKIAGIAECSPASLADAANKSGGQEESSPSCPPSSQIGTVRASAGAGPAPYWTTGKAYLAGPYKGAPYSVAIITPAKAGPFDLGTVVVRSALYLDPETARITVKSDPLPRIVEGVPLNLRTIAVDLDREQFTLNGTSCNPFSFQGSITSTLGGVAPLSAPFQLAECARLAFKPKLSLQLKGSTKRSSHPALTADLKATPGQANIARAQVKLPHAAFLDQSHIGTVCTRVQFAADKCPKRSVYGRAWATSPLVDYKVAGSVYLRSSNHVLPDLVVKLKGPAGHPLEFDLAGKTDAVHGALRNTFEVVPDVPVSRFHLELFDGKRGLIELSDGICKNPLATTAFTAQNGRVSSSRSPVETSCPKKKRSKRHR